MIATEGVLSREEMETRRLAAATELLGGLTQSKVASKYGVSRTTASRWARALENNGVDGLRKRRATGRPSRLRPDQLAQLREIYAEGALSAGFESDRWTTSKLASAPTQAALQARIADKLTNVFRPKSLGRLSRRRQGRERCDVALKFPRDSAFSL